MVSSRFAPFVGDSFLPIFILYSSHVLDYLPVYFQATKGANTLQSSVDMLSFTILIAPFAVACGASVEIASKYRPQNYVGWALLVIGYGLFTMLNVDSRKAFFVGIQVIMGVGHGIVWVAPQFAVLSPLPESNNAYANSFWLFTRYFAQVYLQPRIIYCTSQLIFLLQSWGVAIGGAILQNQLKHRLPTEFTAELPAGTQLAYATIPKIEGLPDALRAQVRLAFSGSLQVVWYVMLAISILGLLSCLCMDEVVMQNTVDEQWGLQNHKPTDEEKGTPSA